LKHEHRQSAADPSPLNVNVAQQLLRSVALFVGSVFFMRNYGEVMVA